jgi:hypothetical protein
MASFEFSFAYMIQHEDFGCTGRIVTDNNGARVRYGINEEYNLDLAQYGFFDRMGTGPALAMAKERFRDRYWQPIGGERLTSDRIAAKLLDMAVNMGPRQAVRLLQRALEVNDDGRVGPMTINAANTLPEGGTLAEMAYQWKLFIANEILHKPEDAKYKEPWEARAELLPGTAVVQDPEVERA